MSRARIGGGANFRNRFSVIRAPSTPSRGFAQYAYGHEMPPVRVRGPVLFCLTAVVSAYLGCAVYEVRRDVQSLRRPHDARNWEARKSQLTYEDLEKAKIENRRPSAAPESSTRWDTSPRQPQSTHSDVWSGLAHLDEANKMIAGSVGLNAALYVACRVSPGLYAYLSHLPVARYNFTLLTSSFGHASLMHLLLNAYGALQFGTLAAKGPVFEHSGSHLTAFYLSTGVLTSLACHLEAVSLNRSFRHVPSLGASGSVMALIGACCMSFPDAKMGIVFLPFYFPAQRVLQALLAFETLASLRPNLLKLGWAHSAHASGLMLGASYVYFNGLERIWEPSRKLAFTHMKRLGLL